VSARACAGRPRSPRAARQPDWTKIRSLPPLGATGARLMTTLLHELERTGGRYGLQVMCEGGGQANVTILERLG
jgi:acetyl-CoA C-acetyltransferase